MWPSRVPRTVINSDLAGVMAELAIGATNTRQRTGDALVIHYRQWADEAYRRLRSYFSDDSLDALVRTRTFWAVADVNPDDPHAKQLVYAELDDAVQRFEELRRDFAAFAQHWADKSTVVVLDTSGVMAHASAFDKVDWFEIIGERPDLPLRLVIPLVVVDELDNLKDRGNKTAELPARKALKTLEPLLLLEQRERIFSSRGMAYIEVLADPPTHRRLASADDEIVTQAAMLAATTGHPTIVATRDTGMLIRATQAGLDGRRVEKLDVGT